MSNFKLSDYAPSIKDQREIILANLKFNATEFLTAIPELLADKSFILACLERNSQIIDFMDKATFKFSDYTKSLEEEKALIIKAAIRNDEALSFASAQARCDRTFTLECVKQSGYSYQHLSLAHKYDIEIIIASLEQDFNVFYILPDNLKRNKAIVKIAVNFSGSIFDAVDKSLANDKDFVRECFLLSSEILTNIPDKLKLDKEFVLSLAKEKWGNEWDCMQCDSEAIDIILENMQELVYADIRDYNETCEDDYDDYLDTDQEYIYH